MPGRHGFYLPSPCFSALLNETPGFRSRKTAFKPFLTLYGPKPENMKTSLKDRLKAAGIRHFDELIHDQSREWLHKYFKKGASKYPVNVARLMRNIIWQVRERIRYGEKPPLNELIRTFWYMYIKPTLSRAGALAYDVDQYKQLVYQFVHMVRDLDLMRYSDIGFRDDNEAHRRVGANANIVLFSEKLGHQSFLSEISGKYRVSIIALGGQPSVLSLEYFVDELKAQSVNLRRSFYFFGIVDYDPSGWIVRDAFVRNLKFYGIKNIHMFDLIHPDMLTPREVRLARYRIPAGKSMEAKNKDWLKDVHSRKYDNQKYLEMGDPESPVLYGLEAEAVSSKRLTGELEEVMLPLIAKSEDLVRAYELRRLSERIRRLALRRFRLAAKAEQQGENHGRAI